MNKPTELELENWTSGAHQLALHIARGDIVGQLADEDITLADEQLDTAAQSAVEAYDNDKIRAECWNHAIGEAVEKATGR